MSKLRRLLLLVPLLGCVTHLVWAQQQPRVPTVGLLVASMPQNDPALETLRNRLRELGYVEGQSIRYEYRSAQSQSDRLPSLAEELVRLDVDVIVAATEPAIRAAKKATNKIPIVMVAYNTDPATSGLVDSFGQPGGNLTGIYTRDSELRGKRLELLKETLPGLSRVTVLWDPFSPGHEELDQAAHTLNIQLKFKEVHAPSEATAALKAARKSGAQAVMMLMSPALALRKVQVAEEALANGLPLMGFPHESTRAGGLITYGTEPRDHYYRVAYFVDNLLKGIKPDKLPVEQVAVPKLVINLKSAKALGISVPQSVLLRADELIR